MTNITCITDSGRHFHTYESDLDNAKAKWLGQSLYVNADLEQQIIKEVVIDEDHNI